MAVYTVPRRKMLKAKNHDLATLLKTMGALAGEVVKAEPGLEAMLRRATERGEDIFVYVCPYSVEIGPYPMVRGSLDFTEAVDDFHSSAESI